MAQPCDGTHDRYVESVLSPHHLIYYIYITLNDANHLHRYGLIYIVGARVAQNVLLLHLDSHIGGVEQLPGSDAGKNEVAGFQCLRTLGAGTDTHGSNRMTDGQVEAALLRQGARVRNDS